MISNSLPSNSSPSAQDSARLENFSCIVERYQSLVWAVAFAATGDTALSDDLTQETFLAAWKQQADIRDLSKMRSYLASIARNLAYRSHRHSSREIPDGGEHAETIVSEDRSPLDCLLSNEGLTQIAEAMRRIPRASREPFVLFYLEEQSISRVAADMGLSDAVVKQRLYRARETLRDPVADEMGSQVRSHRPAVVAAVVGLIVSHLSKPVVAATVVVAGTPTAPVPPAAAAVVKTSAASAPVASGLWLGAAKVIGTMVAVGVAFFLYWQVEAVAKAPADSAPMAATAEPPEEGAPEEEAPSEAAATPLLAVDDEEETTELMSEQPLITGRVRWHVEGAATNNDGRLSEMELQVVAANQVAKLVQMVQENWDDPTWFVGCRTVGMDPQQGVWEGGVRYNIDELHLEWEAGEGEVPTEDWIERQIRTQFSAKEICYQTRSAFQDDVKQLRAAWKGPVPRRVHVGQGAIAYTDLEVPDGLEEALATAQTEDRLEELSQEWGVQISASKGDTFFVTSGSFDTAPSGFKRNKPGVERQKMDVVQARIDAANRPD